MDYKNYVSVNANILRNGEPLEIISNPKKIKKEQNWESITRFEEIIMRTIEYKQTRV